VGSVKKLGCVRPETVVKITMLGLPGSLVWHSAHQGAATAVQLPEQQGMTLPGWRWGLQINLNQQ